MMYTRSHHKGNKWPGLEVKMGSIPVSPPCLLAHLMPLDTQEPKNQEYISESTREWVKLMLKDFAGSSRLFY